jgi:hypothetical protein
MPEKEAEAIRTCIARNRPYGSEPWQGEHARRLGLPCLAARGASQGNRSKAASQKPAASRFDLLMSKISPIIDGFERLPNPVVADVFRDRHLRGRGRSVEINRSPANNVLPEQQSLKWHTIC